MGVLAASRAIPRRGKGIAADAVSSVDRIESGMPRETGEAGLLNDDFDEAWSSLNELAKPVSCDTPRGDAVVIEG